MWCYVEKVMYRDAGCRRLCELFEQQLYYGIGYYCEFAESNAINRFGIKNKKNRSKPFGFEIIFRRKKNKYTLSEKT